MGLMRPRIDATNNQALSGYRGQLHRLIRPADWGVMAVPAGIVPAHPVVGKRAAAAAHRQRDPIRCDGVAADDRPPRLSTAASLIVILLLSLGLWVAIWEAVRS
jgi:hypothetical protein